MPDDGALGDQAAADVVGLSKEADEVLCAGLVPEPDADLGMLGGGGMRGRHCDLGLLI